MTSPYTESTKEVSDVIINELEISDFQSNNISDSEYSFVPLDHNFLQVRTINWTPDGINSTISLGTTLQSKEQIIYVMWYSVGEAAGRVLIPDVYELNAARNSIVLSFVPAAGGGIFIKIIDGLFFKGVQGGSANA